MDIISIYQDAARDAANKDENSTFDYEMFNRMIRRASNRTISYITGDTMGEVLPFAYSTEKAKGFISYLITPYKQQVVDGLMAKPSDFYMFENMYEMSLKDNGCEPDKGCDDESNGVNEIIYRTIELLDGQQWNIRSTTNIELLKPKNKPIAKEVGNDFEFLPKDIANVRLDYIRYPIVGEIVSVYDATYNDQIADPTLSTDTEWPEFAREMLIYFLVNSFADHTSQKSLKEDNVITGQLKGTL